MSEAGIDQSREWKARWLAGVRRAVPCLAALALFASACSGGGQQPLAEGSSSPSAEAEPAPEWKTPGVLKTLGCIPEAAFLEFDETLGPPDSPKRQLHEAKITRQMNLLAGKIRDMKPRATLVSRLETLRIDSKHGEHLTLTQDEQGIDQLIVRAPGVKILMLSNDLGRSWLIDGEFNYGPDPQQLCKIEDSRYGFHLKPTYESLVQASIITEAVIADATKAGLMP